MIGYKLAELMLRICAHVTDTQLLMIDLGCLSIMVLCIIGLVAILRKA